MTRLHGDTLVGDDLLDFAVNVWPLDGPERLRRAMHRALDHGGYPDERPARAAVAQRHRRDPSHVLLANGSCDAIWLLAHTLRPTRAACIEPCFTEARAAFEAAGATVQSVERSHEDWSFDPSQVAQDVEVIYLGNPNNPTGQLDTRASVLALVRPGRLVVVDESFMDFVLERDASVAEHDIPGVAVLRSLTKLWNLAGVRAGYLLGQPELVRRLEAHRQPWSVNAVALGALGVCATDTHSPGYVARQVATRRAELLAGLRALRGVQAWDSAVNFLLLRLAEGERTATRLRDQGIAVRPAADFRPLTSDFIRVSVRDGAGNARLLDALQVVLATC